MKRHQRKKTGLIEGKKEEFQGGRETLSPYWERSTRPGTLEVIGSSVKKTARQAKCLFFEARERGKRE